jgi:hypothetical protein
MGLRSSPLRDAVLAGHLERISFTPNDVATRPGYTMWATPLRYLRDAFAANGFTGARPGGFEVLRSPDGSYHVTVAEGTRATGVTDGPMPSTRIERGPLTGQAVEGNRHQIRFAANVVPLARNEIPGTEGPKTWILLHHFDADANELRVELSLPVEFTRTSKRGESERGVVTAFEPRLVLPPIQLAAIAELPADDEGDDEIEIPVERRRP